MNIIDAPKTDFVLDAKKLAMLEKDEETGLFFSNIKTFQTNVLLQLDEDISINTKLKPADFKNVSKIYFDALGIPVKVAVKEKAIATSSTETVKKKSFGSDTRQKSSFANY